MIKRYFIVVLLLSLFLMSPGFSTNTEVTEFSGRGVGTTPCSR